ncbi:MAG: tyrosine recombinase XerC [Gallionellales bacterium 35-53-114]|jgi:integrase/recombinase XerC|nr:MAG: tyrosine recombinase XerC [Gallionellales bacterium 35-53-114]OYZ63944.1 MAG: tyrosine recombinase XerC [Gallionellales bacterium 24-53-125]OZB09227.1 MAG: tyrosine recombinase XerC [Gallionellales bacterium 39-52-133]HQS59173.1 tyrosine recombinase XerC [Gallionellaceae bacterium]HQS75909.1 tyrosine recombinase XerC [Gallionellaceae bacterium]
MKTSSLDAAKQDLLNGYLAYLGNERQYSPLTLENYARDLSQLFKAAGDVPLADLKSQQIRRFIAMLHGQGLGGKTLARMLSAWRGFYTYLIRDHKYSSNPCTGLRAPKSPRNLPHTLSPDEAVRLVDLPVDDDVLTLRDKAMFELLYSSGLRLAELVGLDPEALDFSDASVRVTGKGNKTRIIPLGSHAISALQQWLQQRSTLAKEDEPALFINRNGARISARSVQLRMKEWGIKQGLSSNVHPHLLRHSFASHVLQSSGDLRAVQEMLGHASISTTQVYTHLDFQYLSKIYDSAHPRAKKKTP